MTPDNRLLLLLQVHRDNLATAKTFEEYRDHHVAYVNCLIEREQAAHAKEQAEDNFMYRLTERVARAIAEKETPPK